MNTPSKWNPSRCARSVAALVVAPWRVGASAAVPEPNAARHLSTPEDITAIRKVVEEFSQAIKEHSGKRLSALVLNSRILFASTPDQAAVDRQRQFDANFDGIGVGGFAIFAHYISTTKEAVEERVHNIGIGQDGPFAWADFDYEFVANGTVENYGVEHWQLRKIDGRWKIFSVVWTQYETSN